VSGQGLADLHHELQLLLGADQIVSFIEAHDKAASGDADRFGNLINYFKDSAYMHARNLLNALTNRYPTEIGPVPASITSELYGKLKDSLERYVMHIKKPRNGRGVSNIRDGRHLNERVPELTGEVRRCWSEWIDATGNQDLKGILAAADESAQRDVSRLRGLMR
jgi:hypothetical protein